MSDLFTTGIRPAIDEYLTQKAAEERDYGDYWSASSAGYCMRLNILRRLKIPKVPELAEEAMRTQRVFEVGHIFHEWAQRITKNAGLSVAQELELQDEDLMVRGHIDDLVLVIVAKGLVVSSGDSSSPLKIVPPIKQLILYDYKTANSQAFNYKKPEIGHYHKMQLGTYMYMLRKVGYNGNNGNITADIKELLIAITKEPLANLAEGRILTISKDDLRMREHQLIWSPMLEKEVVSYWKTLQGYWNAKTLPACTCLDHDGGFMGRRSKKGKVYNDYFYGDAPCSEEWVKDKLPEGWKCTS